MSFVVCCTDYNEELAAKRDECYGFFFREGVAFSRVLTPPLDVVLPYFGICNYYKDAECAFEYFTVMPVMLVVYTFHGAAAVKLARASQVAFLA